MIFKNDIGAVIRLTVTSNGSSRDVSTATTRQIILKKPDGTIVTKTASLTTNGSDGRMQYVVESGVIDQAGAWKVQGRLVIAGTEFRTAIGGFQVGNILE